MKSPALTALIALASRGARSALWIGALLGGAAGLSPLAFAESAAKVDKSATARELAAVPRRAGAKPVVAIYDFRSSVPEIQVGAAREMFVTALIRSGAFAVAERQRLNEGVMRERALGQSGVTASTPGSQGQVTAARYIFEVVVSEANAGASENSGGVNIGGMKVFGGSTDDQIGMDVRIVDAQTGMVVDAVNVVKKLESSTVSVSGVGSLLNSLASLRGKSIPVPVDGENKSSRKEGVDRALRSCIEAAVADLARRLVEE